MNRPCDSCGRILTIPDIPLPDDYTQKCTFCGHTNNLSEQAPDAHGDSQDWDTLDSSTSGLFLHMPRSEKGSEEGGVQRNVYREFEQRLRDLETRLRAELKETARPETTEPSAYQIELQKNIKEKTVLVATVQPHLFQSCESLLKKNGFVLTEAKSLDDALNAIMASPFHIMLLDQNLLKSGNTGKQILKYIKRTPIEVRRCQTVILITPSIATGEPQVFYQWGIDMNINPKDLGQLGALIRNLLQIKHGLLNHYLAGVAD